MTNQVSSTPQAATQQSTLLQAYLMIEELEAKLAAATAIQHAPIAIVGMACRFPGASDPAAFWRLLRDGVDATGEMPQERWDVDAYYDPNPDTPSKMYVRRGGFLEQIDNFDASFFTISPREATAMAPEQRLLLEVAWEALEDAGINPHTLRDSATGVFVGCDGLTHEYLPGLEQVPAQFIQYIETGNSTSVIAGRLAYGLGLQGPTLVTATACSSSLVAVHTAVQSLRAGECRSALVGSVQLYLALDFFVIMSKMHALAPDGRCKTFDALADGYSRGEGCGVLVLKRLDDARADGDRILAVIHGSAVNHDGASAGLTVPNGIAQEKVIRQALKSANVTPDAISYIEAHGTGTPLGDPIEIQALGRVFGAREKPLLVGSVKTNIGHLESAAGIAGLIKVVLSLQHQMIPPHLHFQTPNPHIPWEELPLQIPTTCMPWPAPAPTERRGRLAGVSSFGLSGTNAHVILGEAPAPKPKPATTERPHHLLTLSAKTPEALHALTTRYADYLEQQNDDTLADICFTASHGRAHFAHRLAVVAATKAEAGEKLATFAAGKSDTRLLQGNVAAGRMPTLAFLFTGQGSQYVNMGRELYETQPTFRRTLEQCDEILRPLLGESILDVLYPQDDKVNGQGEPSKIDKTLYTQPVLFALEYALAELWKSWGIEPDYVVGHSVGEYVAACVAGVFSLEDGLRLIAKRAELMQALPQNGKMIAVAATEAQVACFLKSQAGAYGSQVAIAAINSAESLVLSGLDQAIDELVLMLKAEGIKTKVLTVSHAFHSPLMKPMVAAFAQAAQAVRYAPPQIPLIANLSGALATDEIITADYWCRHLLQPVRFADSIAILKQIGVNTFLELGPKPTLLGLTQPILDSNAPDLQPSIQNLKSQIQNPVLLPSLRPNQSNWQTMLTSLGELYVQSAKIAWAAIDRDYQRRKVVLPTYPFQRRRYWLEPTGGNETKLDVALRPLMNRMIKHVQSETMRNAIDKGEESWTLRLFDSQGNVVAEINGFQLDTASLTKFSRESSPEAQLVESLCADASVTYPVDQPFNENEQQAGFLQQWRNLPAEEQPALLLQRLRTLIGKTLGLSPTDPIALRQGFMELGLDSMQAVEVRNQLAADLGCTLPALLLFEYPTLETLANYITQDILALPSAVPTTNDREMPSHEDVEMLLAEIAQITDADIQQMLVSAR